MMLATLFDFPFEEERRLLTWWSDIATTNRRSTRAACRRGRSRQAELVKMAQYFTRLWNERVNAPPKTDLISMLAHGQATRNMPPQEFLGNLVLLIVGGNDTTRNSMTGACSRCRATRRSGRSCARTPRWSTRWSPRSSAGRPPLPHMRRTATQDVELGGQKIRKGDKVVIGTCRATATRR